jgi:ribose transport system substrate-binding protein
MTARCARGGDGTLPALSSGEALAMKTRRLLGIIFYLSCCLLAGCPTQQPPSGSTPAQSSSVGGGTAAEGKKKRVAVIPKGESHEFWKSVRAGALKAGKEFNLDVTFKGPAREGNTDDQIAMVNNKIADGVDGICLAPVDAVALRRPVDEAIQAGIPIVIFDSGLAKQDGIVSFVATNNYRGGERAAEYLAELLKGKGNVILMRYNPGSQSTELREKGFLDKIGTFKNIKMLVDDKNAGPDESGAITLSENLLSIHKDKVDGIFCPNQPTASGMLTTLTKRFPDVAKRVKFVGFDSGTNIAKALESGEMQGTILQDPVNMGYMAVKAMHDHLNKKEVLKDNPVPEELATPENLKKPKIHALLYPEVAE